MQAYVLPKWVKPFAGLVSVALILFLLHWSQNVLIPLAAAILLTFVLTPAVTALQRRGLRRVHAVLLIVVTGAVFFAAIAWVISIELSALSTEFPAYTANLKAKLVSLRESSKGGAVDRLLQMIKELEKEDQRGGEEERPAAMAVHIVPEAPTALNKTIAMARDHGGVFGKIGLVFMMLIFMLINREDLRNRIFALIGSERVSASTVALDDAGKRISRYLLLQFIVNCIFGVVVALGLWLLGVPYFAVWGMLAAILRYIPYVGPYIAAMPPTFVSAGLSHGWLHPLAVFTFFVVIAVITSAVVEPSLYGKTIGVSQPTLIVALAFWTWLWGFMGMLLAIPMTVCLVVLGRHVRALRFLDVLMGDQPALAPPVGYYQRLLAHDEDEAGAIVRKAISASSRDATYDDVLLPALTFVKRDYEAEYLSDEDQRFVLSATQRVVEETGLSVGEPTADESATQAQTQVAAEPLRVLACPAQNEIDSTAIEMLRRLVDPSRVAFSMATNATMASELIELVEQEKPAMVCISSVPPGGLSHCRYLCLRLRARFPSLRIMVGRWSGGEASDSDRVQLEAAGCTHFVSTLQMARDQLFGIHHLRGS